MIPSSKDKDCRKESKITPFIVRFSEKAKCAKQICKGALYGDVTTVEHTSGNGEDTCSDDY